MSRRVTYCSLSAQNFALSIFSLWQMSEIIGGSSICSTWETYCDAVKCWNEASQTIPGAFSYSVSERMWALSRSCPLPDASTIPIITLPLRLHLVQGPELGCSLTWEQCFLELVPMMNNYWRQAGIEWDLIEVLSKDWPNDADGGRSLLEQARHDINKLARDPETGMMAGKDRRRAIFLDKLIPEALQQRSTYDVYMFDFIGNGSQGCCISRESHTIIMGQRSTKGYPVPTARPLPCLAKTMAHELGHALDLNHPRGQAFSDGTPCTARHGRDNLMTGGADCKGGGGCLLEEWQVLVARHSAELFLSSL